MGVLLCSTVMLCRAYILCRGADCDAQSRRDMPSAGLVPQCLHVLSARSTSYVFDINSHITILRAFSGRAVSHAESLDAGKADGLPGQSLERSQRAGRSGSGLWSLQMAPEPVTCGSTLSDPKEPVLKAGDAIAETCLMQLS